MRGIRVDTTTPSVSPVKWIPPTYFILTIRLGREAKRSAPQDYAIHCNYFKNSSLTYNYTKQLIVVFEVNFIYITNIINNIGVLLGMAQAALITTGDVVDHCHVTYKTVQNWIRNGDLKAARTPGGHNRITVADFEEFLSRYDLPSFSREPPPHHGRLTA